MGGGRERKESENFQKDIRKTQFDQGQSQIAQSAASIESGNRLRQPSIDYYTRMSSGDPGAMLTAAAVPLGNLSRSAAGAKESIRDTVPRGAARDFAMANVDRDAYGQSAGFLNQAFLSSFPALQALASEQTGTGLQQLGAGYRGIEGSASTNNQIQQIQQQKKASQMGLIGNLAGMAAAPLTGGLTAMLGGMGGGARSGGSLPVGPNSSASSMLSWMNPTGGGAGQTVQGRIPNMLSGI